MLCYHIPRMRTISIAICGISGRMGTRLASLILKNSAFKLSAGTASEAPKDPLLKPFFKKTLQEAIALANVVIDFSHPSSLTPLLSAAFSQNKPLIIGTTGYSEEEFKKIEEASKKLPIFYSPNFSLGIAILRKVIREIGELFPSSIDIIEVHHVHKKDSPSGTALRLAKDIREVCHTEPSIHAIRSGEIIGEHYVSFTSNGERIKISHEALSRNLFCEGALAAAGFMVNQKAGLYTMSDMIKGKRE